MLDKQLVTVFTMKWNIKCNRMVFDENDCFLLVIGIGYNTTVYLNWQIKFNQTVIDEKETILLLIG